MNIENDCITPAFLDELGGDIFPHDEAHFAGDHDEVPDPRCPKCAVRLEPRQMLLLGNP